MFGLYVEYLNSISLLAYRAIGKLTLFMEENMKSDNCVCISHYQVSHLVCDHYT